MNKAIIAIGAAGLLATACASDPYSGGPNQTVRQGAVGAGLGAGLVAKPVGGLGGDMVGGLVASAAVLVIMLDDKTPGPPDTLSRIIGVSAFAGAVFSASALLVLLAQAVFA